MYIYKHSEIRKQPLTDSGTEMKQRILLGTLLPLFFGIIIYVFFRNENIRAIEWLNSFDFTKQIALLRLPIDFLIAPEWFVYNLPDGLWIFSLTFLLLTIWNNDKSHQAKLWIAAPLVIAFSLEFGQLIGVGSGTFDLMDITFYFFGFILSVITYYLSPNFKSITYEQKN
mgnify:CR=1 FL=1